MGEPRRLHPAAIAIYSAQAFGNAAFPLVVLVGATLLGGNVDTSGLMRSLMYGAIGVAISVLSGYVRWTTTTYSVSDDAIHHHTGFLGKRDTDIPLARVEAIDVHQGVLQRLFGVLAVEVQTGAAGKGGEISLPALTPAVVDELRAARPQAASVAEDAPEAPRRRLTGRSLAVAALTAGQLGIVLPVLAFGGQLVQQLFNQQRGEEAVRRLPHTEAAVILIVLALIAAAWLLSTLGALVAFGGFTLTRDGDRLRISRGLVQRREATVPVGRVRAVRVVEGVLRRPFGLATLTVEVTGYAKEASAARTLFPLVRVRDVESFLREFLPELADEPRGLERPPARAARRYVLLPVVAGAVVCVGAWLVVGAWALVALAVGALYGRERWRAAAWRLRDGRLAVRSLRMARTTVLAPARFRESHTVAQNVLQRRAELADLEVAFGKRTTARIRHLEAAAARSAWAAL
jgi:putative membrane protein